MNAATTEDTGLGWVTFEDEDHTKSCDFRSDPCSRQATHIGTFCLVTENCAHFQARILYCLVHRDRILRQATENGRLFGCPTCTPQTVAYLVRMEAL